jgi:hypothetical protein
MLTDQQREVATDLLTLFARVIREAGSQGIPSGVLYAMICDKLSLRAYQNVILLLKRMNLITEKYNVLYWLNQG